MSQDESAGWREGAMISRQLLLSSSVVLYDTVLTMAPEARIMWRRRLHFIDFLYFVNRYGQVAYALINIISFAPYNYKTCYSLNALGEVMSLLPSLSWAAFSGYRSYALAKGNAFLGWIVFAMSAMFIMPNIVSAPPYSVFSTHHP
ncbi:hypothetical protein BD310DRAFT_933166 [Dichomitus squalens]|uniref:DUF6533 domain-containing protein n=1 Tax=Dichomitus squalens TaxID=114155 RepID=A0A4Q9PN98_9APHY|nr:hypothetical protein BD310DRAFT_933166 [Dichomitus squalens]